MTQKKSDYNIKIDVRLLIAIIVASLTIIATFILTIQVMFTKEEIDINAIVIAGIYRGNGKIEECVPGHICRLQGFSYDDYLELKEDRTCNTNIEFLVGITGNTFRGPCVWENNSNIKYSEEYPFCIVFANTSPNIRNTLSPAEKLCFGYDNNQININGAYLKRVTE